MSLREWFRPPRSVLTYYAIATATGVVCLIWLSARLLTAERVVEMDRARATLEASADRAVAVAQRFLNDLERLLASDGTEPPAGTVLIEADPSSVRVRPAGQLLFVPVGPPSTAPPPQLFAAAEMAEFSSDPARLELAIDAYRAKATSRSSSAAVRAGALIRLGRAMRKAGRHRQAVDAYLELEGVTGVVVEGRPADLLAREARCSTFEEMGDRRALEREAAALRAHLAAARWPLTPALWEFLFREASEWAGASASPVAGLADALAIARATDAVWQQWRSRAPLPTQTLVRDEGRPVLVLTRAESSRLRALIVGTSRLETIRSQISLDTDSQIAVTDRDGHVFIGKVTGAQITRGASDTGLPWNLVVAPAHPDRLVAEAGERRRLLHAGLIIVGLLIAGSSYLTFRGIRRELATARLQSDFVSAVSHEFRTPLTSIRQLSHMLREGRVSGEGRDKEYFGVLVRESERLHRLVERLLSFGRAEAERFRFEHADARDVVAEVVTRFREHAAEWSVDLVDSDRPCPVRIDREMFAMALWNLLDNAMKYSADNRTIRITLVTDGVGVMLAVRDEGVGIGRHDRRRIFRKFVRGTGAATSAVAGSGLGLALVDRVVRAHGGHVRLDSEVGRGSTFTMVIPMESATAPSRQDGPARSESSNERADTAHRREKTA